jgi:SOS response regulatory protein OraA/RecX
MQSLSSEQEYKLFKRAHSIALSYLNRRNYCSYDLEQKLKIRIESPYIIKIVIEHLIENGIINDDDYAKTLSSNLIKYKFKGLLYIKSVLFKKRLDYVLKDYAFLQEIEELEIINLEIYIDKIKHRFNTDKLIRHLLSRGYEFNIIKPLIDNKELAK